MSQNCKGWESLSRIPGSAIHGEKLNRVSLCRNSRFGCKTPEVLHNPVHGTCNENKRLSQQLHGAHETNMMWMSPGSWVMKMFPKGWLEYAGIGQHIYKWLADWTRVVHELRYMAGSWRSRLSIPENRDIVMFVVFQG